MDTKKYISEINNALYEMDNGNYEKAYEGLKEILSSQSFLKLKKNDQIFIKKRYSRVLLALGHFEEGWSFFTFNWIKNAEKFERILDQNRSIKYLISLNQIQINDKLLIWNDGGFGDFIYQLRLLKYIKLSVDVKIYNNKLGHLLRHKELLVSNSSNFDWHLPLVEIPRVLKYSPLKYKNFDYDYLIGPKKNYLEYKNCVGLSYKTETSKSKSIDYELLKSLFIKKTNLDFIIIQKSLDKSEVKFFSEFKNVILIENLDKNNIFEDTFDIVNSVKFIISIDSAVSHIAGYLGKKNYLLLRHTGHFYWGHNKDRSNDYPNHIILKQRNKNDWSTVINKLIKII